jgi:hypothetical protein
MSVLIGVSAVAAAPYHILNAGIQTRNSTLVARSSTITSGIAANKVIVDFGLINNRNHCIRTVDEETSAFRNMMGCTELPAFQRIDALNQVWVDPRLLLDSVYSLRLNGEIYNLGHGVVGAEGFLGWVFFFFTKLKLRPCGKNFGMF